MALTANFAPSRHAELVSASMAVAQSNLGRLAQTWTLKQVQGDGIQNG